MFSAQNVQNGQKRENKAGINYRPTVKRELTRDVETRLNPRGNPAQRVLCPTVKRERREETSLPNSETGKKGGDSAPHCPILPKRERCLRRGIPPPKVYPEVYSLPPKVYPEVYNLPEDHRVYTSLPEDHRVYTSLPGVYTGCFSLTGVYTGCYSLPGCI